MKRIITAFFLLSGVYAFASLELLEGRLESIQVLERNGVLSYNITWMDEEILELSSVGVKGEGIFFVTILHPTKVKDYTKGLTEDEIKERERWTTTFAVHESQKDSVFLRLNTSPKTEISLKEILSAFPVETIPNPEVINRAEPR